LALSKNLKFGSTKNLDGFLPMEIRKISMKKRYRIELSEDQFEIYIEA